jgi:F-type H+-transporting ATPase subunit 8
MPQLIPFYFLNQLFISFAILTILIFILSKYVLPAFVNLHVIRMYITKLSKKNTPFLILFFFILIFIFIAFNIEILNFNFIFKKFYTFYSYEETFNTLASSLPVLKLGTSLDSQTNQI